MKCDEIQPVLLDYNKGLLSGPEATRVRDHLRHCAECSALLAEEVAFAERLARLPEEQPANDVWALVRAGTRPRVFRPLAWLHALTATGLRRAAAAAVAVAVLFVAVYSLKPVDQTPVKSTPQAVTVKWSDDPLGGHTDAMVASIDEM